MKKIRPRLDDEGYIRHKNIYKDVNRVLVIGDTHLPFEHKDYLEFCKEQYILHNCNLVVHIGDLVDNHHSSYHETSADGLGGLDELELVISKVAEWYKAFPQIYITNGNHDLIIMRKAQTSSVPSKWIKEYKEVLAVPNWNFVQSVEIDDVMYEHGMGGQAQTKARNNMQSTVQGHYHVEAYVRWFVGSKSKLFGMQVGCGIDHNSYGMAYGMNFKKPAIGVGIIIDGKIAFNVLMNL